MKLTDEQVATFDEQGWIVLPDVFDTDQVGLLADAAFATIGALRRRR